MVKELKERKGEVGMVTFDQRASRNQTGFRPWENEHKLAHVKMRAKPLHHNHIERFVLSTTSELFVSNTIDEIRLGLLMI